MLVHISLSSVFPADWWLDYTPSEREQYLRDHPKSKYVEYHMFTTKVLDSIQGDLTQEHIDTMNKLAEKFRAKRKGQLKRGIIKNRLKQGIAVAKITALTGAILYSLVKVALIPKAFPESQASMGKMFKKGALKQFLGIDLDRYGDTARQIGERASKVVPQQAQDYVSTLKPLDKNPYKDYTKTVGGTALIAYLSKTAISDFYAAGEQAAKDKEILQSLNSNSIHKDFSLVLGEIVNFINTWSSKD